MSQTCKAQLFKFSWGVSSRFHATSSADISASCREDERMRIEAQNPNPKAPLVRYVAGT